MPKYYFLTGPTGLLGPYLIRDSLRAGRPLAVLARASKRASAVDRIEQLLCHWEAETSETLPRPVVFEGELTRPDLGLNAEALDWISRNCQSVVHNAASVTFNASDEHGEPWASNVGGTEQVLEVCKKTRIRDVHFVSTAYVCGLREGVVHEEEGDVGQTMGNDYERSKLRSEKLLMEASHLDRVTIYRPSIIVGDSKTAYTSAFHGYYAILKLCHTIVNRGVDVPTDYRHMVKALGLKGTERKNLVPVDWVSAVITRILMTPSGHGRTYHVTTPRPVTLDRMAFAIHKAVTEDSVEPHWMGRLQVAMSWFTGMFHRELAAYQAYWRDDPTFDTNHTQAVAADLQCPVLDEETMVRLARFAIKGNFGRRSRSAQATHQG